MSEKIKSEMISRRGVFSLLGIAAALGSVPATLLAVSDAEAQATTTSAPSGAQTGTQRRQERRTHRTERRQARRTGRKERRTERRTGTKAPAQQ